MHTRTVKLSISDQAQLGSLEGWLRVTAPDVRVERSAGEPGPGEQGALDVLSILADSSVLIAAVKILPEFLRSRKTGLSITMIRNGEPITLTASNIDDVLPVLNRLLDE
jgi:hypothetical protein